MNPFQKAEIQIHSPSWSHDLLRAPHELESLGARSPRIAVKGARAVMAPA